eukprot:NODE_52_length_30984_cov_1.383358.p8 type:complete len:418 gc:universal NODE_52_length_30984_cov_1.383358:6533-5280(-)
MILRILYDNVEEIRESILKVMRGSLYPDIKYNRIYFQDNIEFESIGIYVRHLHIIIWEERDLNNLIKALDWVPDANIIINLRNGSIDLSPLNCKTVKNLEIIVEMPIKYSLKTNCSNFTLQTRLDYTDLLLKECFPIIFGFHLTKLNIHIKSTYLTHLDLYNMYKSLLALERLEDLTIGNLFTDPISEIPKVNLPSRTLLKYKVGINARETPTRYALSIYLLFHSSDYSIGYYPFTNFYIRNHVDCDNLYNTLNNSRFDKLTLEFGINEVMVQQYFVAINIVERFESDMKIGSDCPYKYRLDLSPLQCEIDKLIIISDDVLRFPEKVRNLVWQWPFGFLKIPSQFGTKIENIKLIGKGVNTRKYNIDGFSRFKCNIFDFERIKMIPSLTPVLQDSWVIKPRTWNMNNFEDKATFIRY